MPDRLEYTAIDGSRIVLETPGATSGAPASCSAIARLGRRRVDLASGTLAHGRDRAAVVGVVLDEEYEYRGGRLRVGTRESRSPPRECSTGSGRRSGKDAAVVSRST